MTIDFFCEDVKKPAVKYIGLRNWIKNVAANYGKKVGQINYIFCSDEYLLNVNKEYLQHDYYTDVITFDNSDGEKISGDIFISLDRVADNAATYGTQETELFRVIIHGVLHLLGLQDKDEENEKKMRAAEDKCLAMEEINSCKS